MSSEKQPAGTIGEREFASLVVYYNRRLVNFLHRMVGDRERAEDLAQEAFFRAFRHLQRFDPSRKFSTWLYTIAANLARNEIRRRRRSLVRYQSQEKGEDCGEHRLRLEVEDPRTRPDAMHWIRHLETSVAEAVDRLPPHHRQVFVLRELEGRTYEEIAELTRCNLGTVKSRLNRARQHFAILIEPQVA